MRRRSRRAAFALILFGAAFGYVEAAVVVYLRTIHEPVRRQAGIHTDDPLFPLLTLKQVEVAGMQRLLITEIVREAATLLMLAAAGLAAGRMLREWIAGFFLAFGVWDICFYIGLKCLIAWPASLLTWDLLFLIPAPWAGPVLAPVLVSATMIVCSWIALERSLSMRTVHAAVMVTGCLVILLAFLWNCQLLAEGGLPQHFPWVVFFIGELLVLAGFAAAARIRESQVSRRQHDS
jgi:hypothetical protein